MYLAGWGKNWEFKPNSLSKATFEFCARTQGVLFAQVVNSLILRFRILP